MLVGSNSMALPLHDGYILIDFVIFYYNLSLEPDFVANTQLPAECFDPAGKEGSK